MQRVVFLVDGFNLYHSIRDINRDTGLCLKWLNIHNLCLSYLHLMGKEASLECIYYFSAYATHLNDANVIIRHESYIKCLEATGIKVKLGRFKPKEVQCPQCNAVFQRYEEKETDVAMSGKLLELLLTNKSDAIVLMTGDTDVVPAIKQAKKLTPGKAIICAFPYKRKNLELAHLAPGSFKINTRSYQRHQFSDPFVMPDGTTISKPSTW